MPRTYSENIQILAGAGVDVSRIRTPNYANRLAGGVLKQQSAGLAANTQAARGHAAKEKGKPTRVAPEYRRPAPTTAKARAKVYRGGRVKGQLVSGSTYKSKEATRSIDVAAWDGKTDKRAERVIAALAQSDPAAQVRIVWKGPDGHWHEMYRHGRSAGAIAKDIADAGGFRAFLTAQVQGQYDEDETTAEAMACEEWQIIAA